MQDAFMEYRTIQLDISCIQSFSSVPLSGGFTTLQRFI